MTDTPALVRKLREVADEFVEDDGYPSIGWLLRKAADALSLGVGRPLDADNNVGLAEERRQFNARIRELESDLGAAIRARTVLEQELHRAQQTIEAAVQHKETQENQIFAAELRAAGAKARAEAAEQKAAALEHELEQVIRERDREKERTDIVIAEFDAPWPHSHTVGEVMRDPLIRQIHECRAGTEQRAEAAEQALTQLRTAFVKLDALCEEVRSSHRDKDSAEYNQCEDAECVWCQETKAALALAGLPQKAGAKAVAGA